jgi:aminodeoxychorismate lyase
MVVYLNGEFLPEEEARVSVFDRGFLYGDSLFETMRVCHRRVFRWHQHMERFLRGCEHLGIRCPLPVNELRDVGRKLIETNQLPHALMRLTLSRGVGPRGYSPTGAETPTLVLAMYPAEPLDPAKPAQWRLVTSSFRLPPADGLASHKNGSKLLQVMARREAEAADADEALLVNTQGEVAEAASANLFWTRGHMVYTSPTAVGVLPGVTRAVILEICATQGIPVKKRLTKVEMLRGSDALFLTNSVQGIIDVESLDGHVFLGSSLVPRLRQAFADAFNKECGVTSTPAAAQPSPATAE